MPIWILFLKMLRAEDGDGKESYETVMKNAKIVDDAKKQKKSKVFKDKKGETTGMALGWSHEELKMLDEAMKKGMAESDKMKEAGLDPSKLSDMAKWDKIKATKKKDRPSIRLMKDFEKDLTDIDLAKEGYNLQEIDIIKRAREVMKKEGQNPDDALSWVRGEMADDAGS